MTNDKFQKFFIRLSAWGFGFLLFGVSSGNAKHFSFSKTDTTHAATDSILKNWLRTQGVDDDKPVAKTLWLWTSSAELDSVEQQHSLLRTFDKKNLAQQFFSGEISKPKWKNNPLAQMLKGSQYSRTLSAWPCLWTEDDYFSNPSLNQLVKVELEDSALIAVFHPRRKTDCWLVYDFNGNLIPLPEALSRKQQIAVVYYSCEIKIDFPQSIPFKPKKLKTYYDYRTFILCNEKMIKSWHHDVPGMQQEVANQLQYLLLLNAYFGADTLHADSKNQKKPDAKRIWSGSDATFSIAELFLRTSTHSGMYGVPVYPNDNLKTVKYIIDAVRSRWKNQTHPIERYPSRGLR